MVQRYLFDRFLQGKVSAGAGISPNTVPKKPQKINCQNQVRVQGFEKWGNFLK